VKPAASIFLNFSALLMEAADFSRGNVSNGLPDCMVSRLERQWALFSTVTSKEFPVFVEYE
jgi:hypothetical protein